VINGQRYWANLCRAVELVRSVDRAGQSANEQDGQWSLRPDRRRSLLRGCHYKGGTRPIFCGGKGDLGLHRYEHLYSPRMVATKRKIQITKPIYHCGKRCERNQKLGASPPAEVPSLRLQRAARHRRVQVDEERTERVSGRVCTTILHSQQQTIPALLSSPSFHLARQTTPHHTLSSSRVCLDEMNFNRRRLSRINWLRRRRRQMSPLPLLWRPETDGNERRRVDRDVLQSRYTLYF